MSREQLDQIKFWSSTFMKVMLGIGGSVLGLLYYEIRDETKQFQDKVTRSFEKIERNTIESKATMEQIKSDVRLIDYRLKQIEDDK